MPKLVLGTLLSLALRSTIITHYALKEITLKLNTKRLELVGIEFAHIVVL